MQSSRGIDIDEQGAEAETGGSGAQANVATPEREQLMQGGPAEREATAAESAQIEERYRRALADLDNYRKRSAREVQRRVAESTESMLLDWLDVVDSVERAMQMERDGPCREGLRAVMRQMDAVLQRHGASRVGEQGEPFDPQRHDAIATRIADGVADRMVMEVQRSGFALGDRVIRPAQVVVAQAPEHSR
jgi:molecular chaperone GrpE